MHMVAEANGYVLVGSPSLVLARVAHSPEHVPLGLLFGLSFQFFSFESFSIPLNCLYPHFESANSNLQLFRSNNGTVVAKPGSEHTSSHQMCVREAARHIVSSSP
jgi:hypothetical protein